MSRATFLSSAEDIVSERKPSKRHIKLRAPVRMSMVYDARLTSCCRDAYERVLEKVMV